jgi:hypothetical protein
MKTAKPYKNATSQIHICDARMNKTWGINDICRQL